MNHNQGTYHARGRQILLFVLILVIYLTARGTEAGSISGTVTGPNGVTPIAGSQVTAWRTATFVWSGTETTTAANGTYSFSGLADGTYRIEFNRYSDPTYAHEAYDDKVLLSEGSNLVVTVSSVHSNINASLALASRISGHVFAPGGGIGLGGIQAWAYRLDGSLGWRRMGEFVETDATGAYTIGGLAFGPYRVKFQDHNTGNYVSQVYSNVSNIESGLDIVLPATQTVLNINVSLAQAGKISGRVLTTNGVPLSNGSVDVLMWNGTFWAYADSSDGFPDAEGRYTVGGLSNGTYRIKFSIWNDQILDEVYDNVLEPEYGKDITVVAGTTISNINAILDSPAWPPRIVRLSSATYWFEVAYTSTNGATCVLQAADSIGNGWSDVATNIYSGKMVNTLMDSSLYFSPEKTRFWRIKAPATP